MRNEGYKVDATRSNYETSTNGLKKAGLIFCKLYEEAPFVWVDGILRKEDAIEHPPYQRFNKIPGMDYICYKNTLFKSLNEMQKLYPTVFDVYPKTFLLPKEILDFQREHKSICGRELQAPSWVVKPKNSCCGRGIQIVQSVAEARAINYESAIQLYIKPFLINGHKFDFRLYLLIASLDPLVIFIYKEGIARFCTHTFELPTKSNRDKKFMHLTNTAINIENSNEPPSSFTKPASGVFETLERRGLRHIWDDVVEVCRAVIIGIYGATLNNLPKKCDLKSPQQKRCEMIVKKKRFSNLDDSVIDTHNSSNLSTGRQIEPVRKTTNNLITNTKNIPKIARPEPINNYQIIPPPSNFHSKISHSSIQKRSSSVSPNRSLESIEIETQHSGSETDKDSNNGNENADSKLNDFQKENCGDENEKGDEDILNHTKPGTANSTANSDETIENQPKIEPKKTNTNPLPLKKRFFHILGIDIMIDSEGKPKVLELNDRPSLGVTVPFEKELKENLIAEAYQHVAPNGDWFGEDEKSGWKQIYPLSREESARSPYPDIINRILNPSFNRDDPIKVPAIVPKRNLYEMKQFIKESNRKKHKKLRRQSK